MAKPIFTLFLARESEINIMAVFADHKKIHAFINEASLVELIQFKDNCFKCLKYAMDDSNRREISYFLRKTKAQIRVHNELSGAKAYRSFKPALVVEPEDFVWSNRSY